MVPWWLVIMVVVEGSQEGGSPRQELGQEAACYYQPHDSALVCHCSGWDRAGLALQLGGFEERAGVKVGGSPINFNI